ncbi:hypothetical protein TrST_g1182 [Triparma strigata]|uniref:FAD/NAD(P)-binding domain-containing protein n=1 Tax=Triparma strigata TaxID=1606541 RepID=A0A9W7AW56_9STRA|nr:hypothetical protein TrST_g1182 [Triparma strigata]
MSRISSALLLLLSLYFTTLSSPFLLPLPSSQPSKTSLSTSKVVILGGGFGGVYTALSFPKREDVQITLVSPSDRFTFSPLLYELATGDCDIDEVCPTLDSIFSEHSSTSNSINIVQSEVESLDLPSRSVKLSTNVTLDYDYLIVATGKIPQTTSPVPFKSLENDEQINSYIYSSKNSSLTGKFSSQNGTWITYLPSPTSSPKKMRTSEAYLSPAYPLHPPPTLQLKNSVLNFTTINDALLLRKKLPTLTSSSTVTIVGGGYSGVELCTSIKSLLNCNVNLIQRGQRILKTSTSDFNVKKSTETITQLGVNVTYNTSLIKSTYSSSCVVSTLSNGDKINSDVLIFTQPSSDYTVPDYGDLLSGHTTIQVDDCLRCVNRVYGKSYKNVFGLGDIVGGGKATAQKTMQQAGIVGYNVLSGIEGRKPLKFKYVDLGEMLTLGEEGVVSGLGGRVEVGGKVGGLMRKLVYTARMPTTQTRVRSLFGDISRAKQN